MKDRKTKLLLAGILVFGILLRLYKPLDLFMYSHDHDLAGWIIRDILENKHLRLIGQETSIRGMFIGPVFYYLLIPFYLLFGMDPRGGICLVTILAALTMGSYYFIFSKIFDRRVGVIASLIYATSFYTVFIDREVVPTTPVSLWLIWYFYGVHLVLVGQQKKAFILVGILLGLIWNFSFGLSLLLIIIPLALLLSKKKINFKFMGFGVLAGVISGLPLLVFEIRHHFDQVRSIAYSLNGPSEFGPGLAKLDRVMQLVRKNATGLLWGEGPKFPASLALFFLVFAFAFIVYQRIINKKWALIFGSWLLIFPIFFSLNSIIVSEYYLNGMLIIWIAIIALFVSFLFRKKQYKIVGLTILGLFVLVNIYRVASVNIDRSGYLYRKAVVSFIKSDAEKNGYPCVSVSYITEPGYNFGYRYLFWLAGLHVNRPDSGSPVYTIVFPHSMVGRIDKSFGALGLVLPDYGRYNESEVEESCLGENSNLTDPMFGFVN